MRPQAYHNCVEGSPFPERESLPAPGFYYRPIRRPFLPETAVIANIAFSPRNRNSEIAFSLRDTSFFPRFGSSTLAPPKTMFWAPPSQPRVACSKNEVSTPLSGADHFVSPDLIGNLFCELKKKHYLCTSDSTDSLISGLTIYR